MPEKTRVEITETSEPPAKAGFQADLQDRKLMRVYLERIEVKFNGDSPKDKSPHKDNLIIAQLVYPRSGAPNILSTMALNLQSGKEQSFPKKPQYLLFKELIDGETLLKIQVTDRDKKRKWKKFMRGLFAVITGVSLKVGTQGIATVPVLGAVLEFVIEHVQGEIKVGTNSKDLRTTVIGEANTYLDMRTLKGDNMRIDAHLFAPTNLRKKPKGPIMIRKGDKNGSISLRLEFWGSA